MFKQCTGSPWLCEERRCHKSHCEVSRLVGRVLWVVTVISRFSWHVADTAVGIRTLGRVKY